MIGKKLSMIMFDLDVNMYLDIHFTITPSIIRINHRAVRNSYET